MLSVATHRCPIWPALFLIVLPALARADEPDEADNPPAMAPKLDFTDRTIEDRAPVRSMKENRGEFLAYCDALMTAHSTPTTAFAASARRDLTFAHLFEQPERYRGEIVRIEGRLVRLRRFEAPEFLWSQGVHDLYEGWIFNLNLYGPHPTCVQFTDLPSGMQIGESTDYPVVFDGYFFKRYRYQAADQHGRDTALLIGHAPVLVDDRSAAASRHSGISATFLWSFVGLVSGIIAVIGGLTWWYRRGDQHVRARVAASRILVDDDGFLQQPVAASDTEQQGTAPPT